MPQLGVDETRFYSQLQPTLAAQLGIQSEEFVVGFVGRFVPEKGLLTLLSALAQITDIPWKWLLLGRGILQTELLAKAEENGIKERLILVESVPHDEVPKYINLMNVLVLPSETTYQFKTMTAAGWKEQFGHVLIEAMACKVPVIGSDSGEIPYVIGDAGLIFPEGNVAALENCLHQMMLEPELRTKLKNLGYERAIARYTNQALALQLLDFYQQILGKVLA
jgi:glycosyltransferase involved in cell wall biosynthesis